MRVQETIFVNGEWIPSTSSSMIDVINPATEQVIARVPDGTAEDVDAAVDAAANALGPWSQSSLAERGRIMLAAAAGVIARGDEIALSISEEMGKPLATAAKSEVQLVANGLTAMAEDLPKIMWEERLDNALIVQEPVGVVGAITPWNSPLHQVSIKACAAVAAGCAVVLKPSVIAPGAALILTEIMAEAGLPSGVLNVVSGRGGTVGEALTGHPRVDMVSLTGSFEAGQRVMQTASRTVKRVALELGGKSPNVLLDDLDDATLERAVSDGVDDCLRSSGQVCAGLTRMIVPASMVRKVEALAVARTRAYVAGDPLDEKTTLGPVANASQYQTVREYLRIGIEEGAELIVGGLEPPDGIDCGFFVRPTIFKADNSMRIAREEIFGPVLTIITYETDAEALAIANDSPFGLAAGVWASDEKRARQMANHIRAGRVRINGGPLNRRAPHGGFKQSGFGREWGRHGMEEFLQTKSLLF